MHASLSCEAIVGQAAACSNPKRSVTYMQIRNISNNHAPSKYKHLFINQFLH